MWTWGSCCWRFWYTIETVLLLWAFTANFVVVIKKSFSQKNMLSYYHVAGDFDLRLKQLSYKEVFCSFIFRWFSHIRIITVRCFELQFKQHFHCWPLHQLDLSVVLSLSFWHHDGRHCCHELAKDEPQCWRPIDQEIASRHHWTGGIGTEMKKDNY